ncbi:succinyl-diaminopimelate desuccinylase [Propionicicella superfundia]|uniref:succinyl-diaminopimelate desuccinylase n=1 Tax=Propionicicella superfundia TaxID=348582 RepID=UPI00041F12DD|nr:succinyl-diaminopimelate desuccinylase [Propionicicella superfundia]
MALDLDGDLAALLRELVDIPSESGDEDALATQVVETLRPFAHLDVSRHGNAVVARTHLGRAARVVVAGHLDTVPIADNVPSWCETVDGEDRVYGRGSCDQLGGIAVQLAVATGVAEPSRDVTWIFYDCEEIDHASNGLGRLQRERPDLFDAEFAVLTEPTGAMVEGGCQGTLRALIRTTGKAAHSARPWMGHNAVHDLASALDRLVEYEPRQPEVDGLVYRESLNAVRIGGGHAGNVIPDRAWIEVNLRYAPDRSAAAAEQYVRDVFTGYEVEVVDNAAGARPGLDLPVAADFVASVGSSPRPKLGWTDVARFSALGVPAVNFGPGDPLKAHADDEYVPVAQVQACHDALRRWLGGTR